MKEGIITNISLHLAKGQYAETRVVEKKKIPSFYMVGKGTTSMQGITSIDLLSELITMTKAEQFTFITIRDSIAWDNPDGEVYITFNDRQAQKKFLEGFKLLEEKSLVRRTKRSHYMINPNALIPLDYTKALELWNKGNT